jgi:competence protein ComEA
VGRTFWLAALSLVALGVGLGLRMRRPSGGSLVPCPKEALRVLDAGGGQAVAICASGSDLGLQRLPAAWARTVGQKLDLNAVSVDELGRVPGIGKRLAEALVSAREERRGFRSWEEVDAVEGVGPAKLKLLKDVADIHR